MGFFELIGHLAGRIASCGRGNTEEIIPDNAPVQHTRVPTTFITSNGDFTDLLARGITKNRWMIPGGGTIPSISSAPSIPRGQTVASITSDVPRTGPLEITAPQLQLQQGAAVVEQNPKAVQGGIYIVQMDPIPPLKSPSLFPPARRSRQQSKL
jgi:hypothetical protein